MKSKSILVLAVVVLFVVTAWPCESTFAGAIVAWGDNNYGRCDAPKGSNFIAVSAGDLRGLALKSDGSLIEWGSSSWGLMDVPPGNDFVAISASACHSLALTPEPCTVLLLGRGAVMIRRKRCSS